MSQIILWFLGLLFLWLLWTAWRLRLEYFDNYSVLTNARAIADFKPEFYYWKRFILLPVVLAPFFYIERIIFTEPFAFVASHFLSVGVFSLLVWTEYRLARLFISRPQALSAAGLMALNRLLIHFAPFVKEDIPVTLLITAGFYFYTRSQKKTRTYYHLSASLCLGLAMATRYNVIPPLLATLLCLEGWTLWKSYKQRVTPRSFLRMALKKAFFSVILPLAVFFVIPSILYSYLNIVPFYRGPEKILQEIHWWRELNSTFENPVHNILYLGCSMTWPIFIAALGGIFIILKGCGEKYRLLLWPLAYLAYQSFVIANKEARYLFPMLPHLYIFSVIGLAAAYHKIENLLPARWSYLIVVAATVAIGTSSAHPAVKECLRFLNPLYTADYARKVTEAALSLTRPNNRIYWVGPMYSLHDRDPIFILEDKYTYFYHLYNHTLGFYASQRISGLDGLDYFTSYDKNSDQVWAMPISIGRKINDGDVLVIDLEASAYGTKNLQENLKPLIVARARKIHFSSDTADFGNRQIFTSNEAPWLRLEIVKDGNGKRFLRGAKGLSTSFFEIYFVDDSKTITWVGMTKTDASGLHAQLNSEAPEKPRALFLMSYDRMLNFPPPN